MQYIFLEYSIDCAHFLPNVEDGHKCGSMHGHRYDFRIEVAGTPDTYSGWIIDYAEVKKIADPVIMSLDHRELNAISGLENPTCERIATWTRDQLLPLLPGLYSIEVRETARAGAGWRRDGEVRQ